MEKKKKLLMTFKNTEGNRVSLSIDDPREDVTESEIKSVMNLILSKNIFAPNGCEFASMVEAKVIVTDTTPYDLVL